MSEATESVGGSWDPSEIERHRPYLVRYAQLQLRDASAAEDVVQETLLAALQAAERFGGRSSVRTWLTGILKHKIVDHLRRQARERPLDTGQDGAGERETDIADAVFAQDGHWQEFPSDWGEPDRSFESARFWEVLEMCMKLLPERAARAFVMREIQELSTEEICKALEVTPTNCWVMLHRARLALRECLETKWFARQ
jgi:RNA polymerase sigma-70 factor (ECF subfamily)